MNLYQILCQTIYQMLRCSISLDYLKTLNKTDTIHFMLSLAPFEVYFKLSLVLEKRIAL